MFISIYFYIHTYVYSYVYILFRYAPFDLYIILHFYFNLVYRLIQSFLLNGGRECKVKGTSISWDPTVTLAARQRQ